MKIRFVWLLLGALIAPTMLAAQNRLPLNISIKVTPLVDSSRFTISWSKIPGATSYDLTLRTFPRVKLFELVRVIPDTFYIVAFANADLPSYDLTIIATAIESIIGVRTDSAVYVIGPSPPLSITLTPPFRRDSVLEGSVWAWNDSTMVTLSGVGSTYARWNATKSASWVTLKNTTGISNGKVGLIINPTGLVVGTHIDTIKVTTTSPSVVSASLVYTLIIGAKPPPPPTLHRIIISPATVTLLSGATQVFSVTGIMTDSSIVTISNATFQATGGTMSGNTYTAGAVAGIWTVVATSGTLTSTSIATITLPVPTIPPAPGRPSFIAISVGGTTSDVQITWGLAAGATSYRYTSGRNSGPAWSGKAGTTLTPPITFFAVPRGTSIWFCVWAVNSVGESATSSCNSFLVPVITPPAPTLLRIDLFPSSVALGSSETQAFTVTGIMSDSTIVPAAATFTATGGTMLGSVYTAGMVAGSFKVIAVDTSGKADTAAVTITPIPVTLVRVSIAPKIVALQPTQTQAFTMTGKMSDSSVVVYSNTAVTYNATGGTMVTNTYTAGGAAGTYRVIGTETASGKADTSIITITLPLPTLVRVDLAPATVALQFTQTQAFTMTGKMSDSSVVVFSTAGVTFTATGGTMLTNIYTAGNTVGTYRVIGKENASGKADTSSITITAPIVSTVAAIVIRPNPIVVQAGQSQQLCAFLRFTDGMMAIRGAESSISYCQAQYLTFPAAQRNPSAAQQAIANTFCVIWTATGGTISPEVCP